MIINAVSYARFSSNNQREASIEIQQEHINRYCKDNGITIIREYIDRALSATSDNRPQFQQMIKDAESGLFSYVIVYNTSRFCRNIQDHLRYKSILESYGVRIISVNENFDETTPEGDLMSNFMMSINQYYSKDLGRKTYLGCLETARSCKHVGGVPPYGYGVDNDQNYFINEEEAKVVRLIFDMLDHDYSATEICRKLEENGYRNRKGKKFRPDFSNMVNNRKYMGEFVWNLRKRSPVLNRSIIDSNGETDIVQVPHGIPAIISEEQFLRVQKKVALKKHSHINSEKRNYLLSSLVRCGCCGYRMYVDRDANGNGKKNWTRFNYRCYSNSKRRADCDTKDFRVDSLDAYVINLLYNVLLNERYSKHLYLLIRESLGKDYDKTRKEIANNQIEIDKTKEEIHNLVSSLAEAKSIAYQEILKEVERLSLKKNMLESSMVLLKRSIDEFPVFNEGIVYNSLMKMKSMIKSKTVEYLKPVLRLLIKEIILGNEEVQVKVNLNAYLLEKSNKDLEVVIIEKTESIKDTEKQFNQRLSWSSLVMNT